MDNNEFIFCKVEKTACECTSEIINNRISECDIYSGRTKTTLGVSIARQLAFLFMHDKYGISYRKIAGRANMTVNAVMKCVGKAREYRFTDNIYGIVYNLIDEKL